MGTKDFSEFQLYKNYMKDILLRYINTSLGEITKPLGHCNEHGIVREFNSVTEVFANSARRPQHPLLSQ